MDEMMKDAMMGEMEGAEEKDKLSAMLDIIGELRDMAREMMDEEGSEYAEKMAEGPKKVSVMAKDEEGLKEGLKKAEDLMDELE